MSKVCLHSLGVENDKANHSITASLRPSGEDLKKKKKSVNKHPAMPPEAVNWGSLCHVMAEGGVSLTRLKPAAIRGITEDSSRSGLTE